MNYAIVNYALSIPNLPYPRPGHIRSRIPSDALKLHKHTFLMFVLHHDSFDTGKWAADDDHGIADYKLGYLILLNNDILVAGFDDDAETLHLAVGDGQKIILAERVCEKVIVVRSHAGEHGLIFQKSAEVVRGCAQEQEAAVERLIFNFLRRVFKIFVGVFDVADERQVRLKRAIIDRNEFVIDFLCAAVSCADWEPVAGCSVQGVTYRHSVCGNLSVGILRNYCLRTVGYAVMDCAWVKNQCFHRVLATVVIALRMENSNPNFDAAKVCLNFNNVNCFFDCMYILFYMKITII